MECIFTASNSIEAHLISDLLNQQGIESHIHGEMLQGGVGDLEAHGYVRVMVDEKDLPAAKKFIEEWDALPPAMEQESEADSSPSSSTKADEKRASPTIMIAIIVGILMVTFFMFWF